MTIADDNSEIVLACFHGLGDVVNATSLLEPLKERWPERPIRWITAAKIAPLFWNNPLVGVVEAIDGDNAALDTHYAVLRERYGDNLITPAPYMNVRVPRGRCGKRRLRRNHETRSLIQRMRDVAKQYGLRDDGRPLLYMTAEEIATAASWLDAHNLSAKPYVLLEWQYSSAQSWWTDEETATVVRLCHQAGVAVVGACPDPRPGLLAFEPSFRLLPALYNRAHAFIGVNSGPSCIVHTHQCRTDIPHAEFVRAGHKAWSTIDWRPKVVGHEPSAVESFLDRVLR